MPSIDELSSASSIAGDDLFPFYSVSGGGTRKATLGAVASLVRDTLGPPRDYVSVKDAPFNAKGDGVSDDTDALQRAIDSGFPVLLPAGTYVYSGLTRLNRSGLSIVGQGSGLSILKYTGTGDALKIDAFESGSPDAPYLQNIVLRGFSIEGNANTTALLAMQGAARCDLSDINVLNADHGSGIGFLFSGIQLSKLDRLMCSQDRQAMTSVPYEGFRFQAGTRAGVNVGNCSNLIVSGCYAEGNGSASGVQIGWRLAGADQCVFLGGSPESCATYGITVSPGSRMNTFIGVGCENLNSPADFADAGISNKFLNCYGSQKVILQGRNAEIDGGYYERIQIDAGAKKNAVRNVVINNWATGAGGFFNSDPTTEWRNLYDQDAGAYVYPLADRTGITVTASPFQWKNTTGQYVEVVIQGGTLGLVRQLRGSDAWTRSNAAPSTHLLPPGDTLEVTYSAAPSLSYVPHNGFQG